MSKSGTTTQRLNGYRYRVTRHGHEIIADVDEKLGGTDQGSDPHDLLESALAACKAITMQMYARRKGWPLQSADVQVRIEKEEDENLIAVGVELHGDLTPEQRERLHDIASRCPIHKFLTRKTVIDSRLL